jgi:hypothetical protein
MVSRWRRLGYSLLSFVIVVSAYTILGTAGYAIYGWSHNFRPALGITAAGVAVVPCLYSIPAWVVAVPVVLTVERMSGWRFWAMLAMGTALGPLAYAAFAEAETGFMLPIDFRTLASLWLPAVVAGLTALGYLLLVHRAQRRSLA